MSARKLHATLKLYEYRKHTTFFAQKEKKSADNDDTERGIFLPAERRIGSCMTRRPDIVWIDAGMKRGDILQIILAHPDIAHFPVCSLTVDSVLGVLSARAFLISLQDVTWPGLKALVKKPVYLPETATILSALTTLAENDCHVAFIIDEYGGIEGLVTRNGLVTEILADVPGGGTGEEPDIFQRADGSWLVGGEVRMEEIRPTFALPDTEKGSHDYYTLAGYLLALNGSIPKTGDRIRAGDYTCEIVDMDGHRIDKVLIQAEKKTEG